MKAYELYQQDQVNGDAFVRDSRRERRQYYLEMRTALREECTGGRRCELVEALGKQLDKKQLDYMYLLDAAAVWECYESVIEANWNSRDIGRGLPFAVGGRTLPWNEVQRLSEGGELPVAVVDAELANRLIALLNFSAARGVLKEKPPVNVRATLRTADPRDVKLPAAEQPRKQEARAGELEALRAEIEQLRQLGDEQKAQLEGQSRQIDAFRADNAALRGQIDQLQQHQETTRDYAIRAAGSILAGRTEEARALASQLDERLQSAVQELERTAADCRALRESIARTQEKLDADRAQLKGLRQQEQEAAQATTEMSGERAQAQLDASRAVEAQQAAKAELEEAMALLSRETRTLRGLRQKADEARKACELTQRQIEALS